MKMLYPFLTILMLAMLSGCSSMPRINTETTFPVSDPVDLKLLQRAEGAKLGDTTLPSGKVVPLPPQGKEWRVRQGRIVLEEIKQ